jgi:hypothetical protein
MKPDPKEPQMTRAAFQARRTISRLKEVAADADYAQRRLLEIRTGVPFTRPEERRARRPTVADLEQMFAAPHAR